MKLSIPVDDQNAKRLRDLEITELSLVGKEGELARVLITKRDTTIIKQEGDPQMQNGTIVETLDATMQAEAEQRALAKGISVAEAAAELWNDPVHKELLRMHDEASRDPAIIAKRQAEIRKKQEAVPVRVEKVVAAEDQLEALAKRHADANGVDIVQARAAVVQTPEGRQLYKQSIA